MKSVDNRRQREAQRISQLVTPAEEEGRKKKSERITSVTEMEAMRRKE